MDCRAREITKTNLWSKKVFLITKMSKNISKFFKIHIFHHYSDNFHHTVDVKINCRAREIAKTKLYANKNNLSAVYLFYFLFN